MSYDIKGFNACNHTVNNKIYDYQLCPKCYGKGYYFDVYFDKEGKIATTTDEAKLQQEMLKVIIDHKYDNLFHQDWGSQLHSLIGSKNDTITKNKIKMLARQAEEYLQKVQVVEFNENNTLEATEIIQDIVSVNVKEVGPTAYLISIIVSNTVGDVMSQTLEI
jgi:hypothetical protein